MATANGVIGLFPAYAVGDDIEVYLDESRSTPHARCCTTCAGGIELYDLA